MRDTLLTYESKSMEKEKEQIGGLMSECMKPDFAGINDLIGRSPLTGKTWSMSVTERLLLGFTSVTWWDFNIKKESIYLFWGPSPTRYSITLSRVPLSLGSTGLARGGPGGCIPTTTKSLSGKNILRPWTQHWSCPQVQAEENMMLFFIDFFFFLTASHWIWLAKHVQDPCCVGK